LKYVTFEVDNLAIMNRHILFLVALSLLTTSVFAQWYLQAGIGVNNTITGYSTITNGGMLYQLDVSKRLKNDRFIVSLTMAWARMHNDNNSSDKFENAQLDQIPVLLTIDYDLTQGKYTPYIGLGLGASTYNLSYNTSESRETFCSVSFSMMPRIGVRFETDNHLYPFIEVNLPLVMDGPPQGAGRAQNVTGYVGGLVGVAYRF
jgi:hypothetical protein